MIKKANVKIDGLTVIAGENDTGKSTVGKALYLKLNFLYGYANELKDFDKSKEMSAEKKKKIKKLMALPRLLFANQISQNGNISLLREKEKYAFDIENNIMKPNESYNNISSLSDELSLIMIETPLVWNFTDFFRDIAQIESQMRIELDYPYLMKDLNFKLHIKSASSGLDIKEKVTSLMGGEFKKDEMGRYYFDKQGQRIELVNTATGIKYFAIFQVLSQNNYLNKDTVLVLDEPEVHLHPKWQLEIAKIIVTLVKNGVKIVVNSHSPYMIEALQRYSELEKVNSDFYLAKDGSIKKENDSNAETLEKIFEKLAEPFDVFEEMNSQSMEKLING